MSTVLSQCKYIVPRADLGMGPGGPSPPPPACVKSISSRVVAWKLEQVFCSCPNVLDELERKRLLRWLLPPASFCGLWNISALHVQYGIQTFAKFKSPECTRLHLRKLQSQKFSWRSMCPKLPEKIAVRSPDRQYCAHTDSVYYISRPPLSQNPSSAPVYSSACTRYESQVMWSSRLSSNVNVILLV